MEMAKYRHPESLKFSDFCGGGDFGQFPRDLIEHVDMNPARPQLGISFFPKNIVKAFWVLGWGEERGVTCNGFRGL